MGSALTIGILLTLGYGKVVFGVRASALALDLLIIGNSLDSV